MKWTSQNLMNSWETMPVGSHLAHHLHHLHILLLPLPTTESNPTPCCIGPHHGAQNLIPA